MDKDMDKEEIKQRADSLVRAAKTLQNLLWMLMVEAQRSYGRCDAPIPGPLVTDLAEILDRANGHIKESTEAVKEDIDKLFEHEVEMVCALSDDKEKEGGE